MQYALLCSKVDRGAERLECCARGSDVSEHPLPEPRILDKLPAYGMANYPHKEELMVRRLVARSVLTGALLLGGAASFGTSRAHAQWNSSPQAQPVKCASWQTAHGGGFCREDHFNQAGTGNSRTVASVV